MAISDLAFIDETGYNYSDYPTVLKYFQDAYRAIYGADVYLEPDSQDGQWVAVQAQAVYDCMALGAAVYNSFSPSTAVGNALARNVKINGIKLRVPTYSNADVTIVGQVGTEITDGIVEDSVGVKWALPVSVVIPASGSIVVNAVARELGAIQAPGGSIDKIATPTRGWQSVSNALAAVPGEPVEQDAELRVRQSVSTALPSLSVLDGTVGAVANVTGVTRYRAYENDSPITDSDGIPRNSISMVVEGGSVQAIADAIAIKKTPGTGTHGDTSAVAYDKYGVPNTINFFRPAPITIAVKVTIDPLQGYTAGYENLIKTAVASHINALSIGADVLINKIYVPANLPGTVPGTTFDIVSLEIAKNGDPLGLSNLIIAFNEAAECTVGNVEIVI